MIIEFNNIYFGETEKEDFEKASEWASNIFPDMNPIAMAERIANSEGTSAMDVLEDWCDSQNQPRS